MRYYLAMDGGGSKLEAILFNEEGTILGTGLSGGVNSNVHSAEAVSEHFYDCMNQIFSKLEKRPDELEAVIVSQGMVKWREYFKNVIPVKEIREAGEGVMGILACGLDSGICALSGTGSDIYRVENAKHVSVYGGWGYMLSDDGSGVWIGTQAARSWMRVYERVEEPTLLHKLMEETFKELGKEGLITAVYRSKSPAFYLGSFCKIVNKAAQQGDETAIAILKEAGVLLAKETVLLIERDKVRKDTPIGFTSSVFRYCTHVRESFIEYIKERYPEATFHLPRFEPVVGAVIYGLLQAGRPLDENMMRELEVTCSAYRIEY